VVYKGAGEAGREVAIKVLHGHLAADDGVRRGFLREAEAARRVAAFCTAAILDAGVVGGRPYIVSEYVPGETLQALVRASGPRTGGALDRLAISTLTAPSPSALLQALIRPSDPANALEVPGVPATPAQGVGAGRTRSGSGGPRTDPGQGPVTDRDRRTVPLVLPRAGCVALA
ncbi:hypothetical protein C1J01_44255, partial [Nonomuraea aridisoli]